MTPKILLATNNPGKRREFEQLLLALDAHLLTPADLSLELHVEETGSSYQANAVLKARAFAAASGLPSLADDSGLEVEALDGAPGIHSARYAPQPGASDADRRAYLLSMLAGKPRPWKARFCCVIAVAVPGQDLIFGRGSCPGVIVPSARGDGGFGYDPVFELPIGQTMAELPKAEKNRLSHRARAVVDVLPALRRLLA
jgi:XTP/dITP diphosphohydrolase